MILLNVDKKSDFRLKIIFPHRANKKNQNFRKRAVIMEVFPANISENLNSKKPRTPMILQSPANIYD
jgi:putative lipase involved disintegration of autophagic bodies